MTLKKLLNIKTFFLIATLLFVGCSPYKHISENGYLLSKHKVLIDSKTLPKSDFANLIKQDPNSSILGVKLGMYIYSLSPRGEDSTVSFISRNIYRKLGQKPVEFEKDYAHRSTENMKSYLKNKGCFDGTVSDSIFYHKKKAKVYYYVHIGERYKVDTFFVTSQDKGILSSAIEIMANSPIKKNIFYDEDLFDQERDRLALELNKSGYYDFAKEYILFNIDTNNNNYVAKVNLEIQSKEDFKSKNNEDSLANSTTNISSVFRKFKLRNIYIYPDIAYQQAIDTNSVIDTNIIFHRQKDKYGLNKYYVIYSPPQSMNIKTILRTVMFQRDSLYSPIYAERTYSALNQLKNYKFIDISYDPILFDNKQEVLDTSLLDCFIKLSLTKPVLFSTSLEANFSAVNNSLISNNTSNFGMELNAGIQHKNIFKGAEIFSFNGKTAFELKSDIFNNKVDTINKWSLVNAFEAGFDFGIEIPRFLMPFGTKLYSMQFLPHTTIKTGYNFQKRNYFERSIFNLNFGYSWNYLTKYNHAIIPIEINLVKMNVTSQYYVDYIKTLDKRIRYQYSDHLVSDSRYSFMYNGQDANKKTDFTYVRFNIESAGNLFYLTSNLSNASKNDLHQYTIFEIPYAQYLRTDIDIKRYHYIGENQVLVFRAYGGIGMPYGNSSGLPYEKSFFSGGNNNHRAWELREIGPGSSKIDDTKLRYDRSGDVQLGGNIEYRFPIISVLEGAAFVDVGNIWNLHEQKDMAGGQMLLKSFYKEFATGLGLGIRLNIQFLIIRFDLAVKVWDPSKPVNERWVIPQTTFNKINMNVGIGYPF
ncbi:MAG: BamA/TamA family outer membrane protein [Bacteroidales bacterium]|nr:BamA/TamA family outer membrane protein [Bacteroidales bacterium]MDD4683673.1 BamA/TamA family outer membrane protein [Bacteroidales bacterium]